MTWPPPKPPQHPSRYGAAERLVSRALEKQGWRILARNFRAVGTELDLVAQKGGTLVVVEVKQRVFAPRTSFCLEQLLPWPKRQALRRGANAFLLRYQPECVTVRFDLALVVGETKETGTRPASLRYFVNVLI